MHRTPEALDTLIADADRTLRRQKICRKHLHENINKVVQQIEKIQQEISSNSDKMDEVYPSLNFGYSILLPCSNRSIILS